MPRMVLRHLSGSRSQETDILELENETEVVIGPAGAALVRVHPPRDTLSGQWRARIIPVEGRRRRFVLLNLHSEEGVFVNHRPVSDAVLLRPGDVIQLGEGGAELEFSLEDESPP